MPENLFEQSREFYKDYFRAWDELSYDNKQRYGIVFSLIDGLALNNDARVLDVGSGSGRITEFLKSRFDDVVAVDITTASLMQETLSAHNVGFAEARLPELPFCRGAFDLIVCSEVIEHLPTRELQYASIESLAQVLTEGGYLVLSTPNPQSPQKRLKEVIWDVLETVGYERKQDQLVENWISPSYLRDTLSKHFDVETIRGSYYNLPPFGTNIDKKLQPLSDAITKRRVASQYGLYQYYVGRKPVDQ